MSRKKTEKTPDVYRFMCIRNGNSNYHVDFTSQEEALQYVNELNDPKIEWYGVYEISPDSNNLKLVTGNRLIPFNDHIVVKEKETKEVKVHRKRRTK